MGRLARIASAKSQLVLSFRASSLSSILSRPSSFAFAVVSDPKDPTKALKSCWRTSVSLRLETRISCSGSKSSSFQALPCQRLCHLNAHASRLSNTRTPRRSASLPNLNLKPDSTQPKHDHPLARTARLVHSPVHSTQDGHDDIDIDLKLKISTRRPATAIQTRTLTSLHVQTHTHFHTNCPTHLLCRSRKEGC